MTLSQEIATLERSFKQNRGRFITLATAESATSGRVADRLTDIPGSSDYFLGGVASYSNEAKMRLLGVQAATLQLRGAVSPEVACEMAEGARRVFQSDIAVSDTGIAGPAGATPGKPVGLFYLCLSAPEGCQAFRFVFRGDRSANKESAVNAALTLLRDYLLQCCNVQGAQAHGNF